MANAAETAYKRCSTPGTPTLGIEGATLASSASVSLAITSWTHAVSGTNAQALIDLPYDGFAGSIALRPTGVFTLATGGTASGLSKPIGLAATAVVGKIMFVTYVPSTGLWYPSYVA